MANAMALTADEKRRRQEMKDRLTKMRTQQLTRESIEMYMEQHNQFKFVSAKDNSKELDYHEKVLELYNLLYPSFKIQTYMELEDKIHIIDVNSEKLRDLGITSPAKKASN